MNLGYTFREPGLNETRCIVRHGLRFYHGLVVAGIYNLTESVVDTRTANDDDLIRIFSASLSTCIHEHPILSALINGADSEKPSFSRASHIDLSKHVKPIKADQFGFDTVDAQTQFGRPPDEGDLIHRALEYIVHDEFDDVSTTPPWRVYLLPLQAINAAAKSSAPTSLSQRVLVAYSFSHSHGDGASALAFHRTFLRAINDITPSESSISTNIDGVISIPTPEKPLPPAIDSPNRLPISWTYLFSTLIKEFLPESLLPSFLRNLIGQPPTSTVKPWTGSPHFFHDKLPVTAIRTLSVPSQTISSVLAQTRKYNTKLTGVLHQIITNTLCSILQTHGIHSSEIITATPIDLRRANGTPIHQMGVMASTVTRTLIPIPAPIHARDADTRTKSSSSDVMTRFWDASRETTTALSSAASTLWDQPIALLRYLSSMRAWHTSKLGKARETSYELSNIMAFEGGRVEDGDGVRGGGGGAAFVEKMIYVQGADVTAHALAVNVVSVRGGDLVIAISWQVGALGLVRQSSVAGGGKIDEGVEAGEREFVSKLATGIEEGFTTLSQL